MLGPGAHTVTLIVTNSNHEQSTHAPGPAGSADGQSARPRRRRRRMQTDARNRRCPPAGGMHPEARRRLCDRGSARDQRHAARPQERVPEDQDREHARSRHQDRALRSGGRRRAAQHATRHDGARRAGPRSRTDPAGSPRVRPAQIRRRLPRLQGQTGGRRQRWQRRRRRPDQRRAETGEDALVRLRRRQEVQGGRNHQGRVLPAAQRAHRLRGNPRQLPDHRPRRRLPDEHRQDGPLRPGRPEPQGSEPRSDRRAGNRRSTTKAASNCSR